MFLFLLHFSLTDFNINDTNIEHLSFNFTLVLLCTELNNNDTNVEHLSFNFSLVFLLCTDSNEEGSSGGLHAVDVMASDPEKVNVNDDLKISIIHFWYSFVFIFLFVSLFFVIQTMA